MMRGAFTVFKYVWGGPSVSGGRWAILGGSRDRFSTSARKGCSAGQEEALQKKQIFWEKVCQTQRLDTRRRCNFKFFSLVCFLESALMNSVWAQSSYLSFHLSAVFASSGTKFSPLEKSSAIWFKSRFYIRNSNESDSTWERASSCSMVCEIRKNGGKQKDAQKEKRMKEDGAVFSNVLSNPQKRERRIEKV